MSVQTQNQELRPGALGSEQQLARHFVIVGVLIAAIGSFYLATIRDGHVWGDDYALYIQHAKNIVEHVSYGQTNYIFDPQNPSVGPGTFPPGYPALLALVYWQFGMNFRAMKAENVVIFILFLLVLFVLLRPELPFVSLVTAIAIIGFNPYVWDLKDAVASDIPFLLFASSTLFLMRRTYRSFPDKLPWVSVIAIAMMMYFAYATRSIGLVFIPILFLYELLRFRRLTRMAVAVTAVFLIGWIIQGKLLHNDSDYLLQISLNPKSVAKNAIECVIGIERLLFWLPTLSKGVRFIIFGGLCCLAALGYLARIRREVTIYELFPLLYSAILTVFPLGSEPRYMLPVFPLFLLFVFSGVQLLPKAETVDSAKCVVIVLLVGTASVYASIYATMNFGAIKEGIGQKETVELFDYVRTKTEPTAVFIFRKPRALGLFGQRRASVYHPYHDESDLWEYVSKIHADYLVEGPIDEPYWHSFIVSERSKLQEVYSNAEFTVYRIFTNASESASLRNGH